MTGESEELLQEMNNAAQSAAKTNNNFFTFFPRLLYNESEKDSPLRGCLSKISSKSRR